MYFVYSSKKYLQKGVTNDYNFEKVSYEKSFINGVCYPLSNHGARMHFTILTKTLTKQSHTTIRLKYCYKFIKIKK